MSTITDRIKPPAILLTRSFYWAVISYGLIWLGGAAMVFNYGKIMATSASLTKVLLLGASIGFFVLGQRSLRQWKKAKRAMASKEL